MAPRVVAVNLVFGTFVRIVASASAQNVFAHATSMLVCHRCRQLGPLTTNLNRGPMSRLLFLGASYRACCRLAFPNDSRGMFLLPGKKQTLGRQKQMTSSFRPSLLPSSPSPSLAVPCLSPDRIVDIWPSDEFDCDFDLVAHKRLSGIMLFCSFFPCLLLALLPPCSHPLSSSIPSPPSFC